MQAVKLSGGGVTVKTTRYSQFKGVDFSTDPMLVDESRSPYAVNLISDTGGMPEKRPGWRTLHRLDGRINGLYRCEIDGENHYLAHAGTGIWRIDPESEEYTQLRDGVNDERSTWFWLKGALYILTGTEYLKYDGKSLEPVEGYVPTVVVSRKPTGGGTNIEGYNLIGAKWIEEFIGDGSSKTYQLTAEGLDAAAVECEIWNAGTGEWVKKTEGTDFTVDRENGTVTFGTAPESAQIPNVKLKPSKTRAGYADKVRKAKAAAIYNDEVIFLAGAEKGIDYRSGYGQPGYFSDTGYDRIGTDETDIMGYCKVGEYLGIVKESNSQDNTIYLRWTDQQTTYNADGSSQTQTVYRKKQGVVGVGAVSRHCIGTLLDEPLFLSEQGIFALTSNAVTFERTVQNRSSYLDFKLTREAKLSEAVGTEWQGYYIVSVNGRGYVLDSRQPTQKSRTGSSFVYEGYYWENIPARVFLTVGDTLYFGTEDGRICRFNTDIDSMAKYSDDGEAIVAIWSTKSDDDGYPQHLKTMVKKGCSVTIKPLAQSSAEIYVRTEKDTVERKVREGNMDIFDWASINFERFTFNSNDAPQEIMVKRKEKKYKRLQFVIRNSKADEGFGIFQIVKCYKVHSGLAK